MADGQVGKIHRSVPWLVAEDWEYGLGHVPIRPQPMADINVLVYFSGVNLVTHTYVQVKISIMFYININNTPRKVVLFQH